jgi:hypothetical protein
VYLKAGNTRGYCTCYSPGSERAESKLAMPISRRIEKAGQSVVLYFIIKHLRDELKNFIVL